MNIISDKELNMLIDVYKDYENLHEEAIYEAAAELKHYRELAAQGRLIELPCAVGDTVYQVINCNDNLQIEPVKIIDTPYKRSEGISIIGYRTIAKGLICYSEIAIGRSVFLNREAAEAKLKEMEGVE